MTEKNKKRSEKWSKRVCVTQKSHDKLEEIKEDKNYSTLAGTLDMIINNYEEE